MLISKVDSILLKHPFFANMETSRRLAIYNKVYTKVFYERSDITAVNRTTYPTDASYELHLYRPDSEINLSAHKDVDSLMGEENLLKGLTDEQKIVIFEIAAYKINIFRTLREDQEYYFNTHKADAAPIVVTNIFTPLLVSISKVLSSIVRTLIFNPLAKATAVVLTLSAQTNYFIPILVASSRIWGLISNIYIYKPIVSVSAVTYGDSLLVSNLHLPLLTVTRLIISAPARISVTYSPSLSVNTQVIVETDYIESVIYQPILAVDYDLIQT